MRRSSSTSRTSCRQSIQPLRVQDTNKIGLHTPQPQDRTTFGKLSVGKHAPGTSERKTSFFGKRTSGPGSLRNSQYGAFGSMEKIKDPRPLHDKAFIQQCIRQLCDFLITYGYGPTVSVKSLQAPSVKDFVKIFTFIYGFFCPSYELPDSKYEEEIPRIFKEFGYPFALSKSSMYTVGAPHTWPQIVAALVWLIDCVKLYSAMKENPPSFDEGQTLEGETEDGIIHRKLFLDYTIKCYDHFMRGGDAFEDFDAEVQSKLKDLFKIDENHIEALQAEEKSLNEKIARHEKERESEPDRLVTLRKLKSSLQTDVLKYETYMTNLESHSSSISQKSKDISDEIEAAALEIEALKQKNTHLRHICDNQKHSVADIERLNREREELQQAVNKLTKELEAEQHQLWNEELKYARGKEAIEVQLADYHKLARKLKLIPPSTENSGGVDFEIKFNPDAGQNSLAIYKTQIQAPLACLLKKTREEISLAMKRKNSLEDAFEQERMMEAEQNNSVKMLREEAQKLEDICQQKMKEAEEEEEKSMKELEMMEKHKCLLESGVNEGVSEAVKELHEIRCRYQVVMQITSGESRKIDENLQHLLEIVSTHLASVEKYLMEQNAKIDREFHTFMSEDLLANLREILNSYKKKTNTLYASNI
ncbi:kinetochore protein NDC80 homolog [Hemicordylus capensis]|uniref:kinetochore protein NDC80 homolog n=1 Tax=Hemicordylus capensis TaxID=884348 RepID=UPI002303B409|nr:kinetochore protein NDC80 homolog [Hemicordylus capensis]XP_053169450.1 kinetochore protein NDC80 homolog [Hemicordylus capensis]XP_053169451.1 kinetochore protein NDC80 homolog [Hemicordylus capensis]